MTAWYNEVDPYAAEWLRNLIAAGHIAPGVVDERDIRDVKPADLAGFTQCHFFAGIGIWSYALRQSGWADDRQVWTGSCPCQPFSAAGRRKGAADERHLWPHWFHLIGIGRPDTVFGEQVAGKDGLAWLDTVQADMEALDYALGAVPFPAAGVGAPETGQRTYFVATPSGERCGEAGQGFNGPEKRDCGTSKPNNMAEADSGEREGRTEPRRRNDRDGENPGRKESYGSPASRGKTGILGAPDSKGPQGWRERRNGTCQRPAGQTGMDAEPQQPGPVNGFWRNADWLFCRDGKWRSAEEGTFPLVNGDTNRVGSLRAYGNALNAEQARAFVESYVEAEK